MKAPLLLAILAVTAFAGCVDDADTDGMSAGDVRALPQLHGWILDEAVVPILDVEVQATAGNVSLKVQTDTEGFYGFDGLPAGVPVVLIARAEGFDSVSRQTTLQPGNMVQMNITMARTPVVEPYYDTLSPFYGFIACQYRIEVSEQKFDNECGAGNNDNQWQVTVGPDFAGGVVELEWASNTDLSSNLHAVIECATPVKCGDDIPIIAENIGTSRLRLEISNLAATKYFPDGGIMLMTVTVDPANDASEAGVGGAVAVSQEFEAIASMFYHAPPPSGFSVG